MTNFAASLIAFATTVAAILALRPIAKAMNLIDRPGGRKNHHGEVPIIGGLGMFIGTACGLLLASPSLPFLFPLMTALLLMVLVGMLDDRFHLSPWTRLPFQFAAAATVVFGTDTYISTLGSPFGLSEITLPGLSGQLFSMLLLVALINAFNMLDGMDGLAGMAGMVAFIAYAQLSIEKQDISTAIVCSIAAASTTAFLIFNAPLPGNSRLRCFMGDAGSTFLGLALGWAVMRLSGNDNHFISPISTIWIIALPVLELICSVFRRLLKRQSPFHADAAHFHHLMIQAGFGVRAIFAIFTLVAVTLALIGMVLIDAALSDLSNLVLLTVAGALFIWSIYKIKHVSELIPHAAQRKDEIAPHQSLTNQNGQLGTSTD